MGKFFSLHKLAIIFIIISALVSIIWLLTHEATTEPLISLFSQLATLILIIDKQK